mmetsp:Transcript_36500/g.88743  ORF Transcript_36500/g.88743 Transcript_36500/m.88743 type:complete len:353 (-) Transcript_36500:1881-2939(-)
MLRHGRQGVPLGLALLALFVNGAPQHVARVNHEGSDLFVVADDIVIKHGAGEFDGLVPPPGPDGEEERLLPLRGEGVVLHSARVFLALVLGPPHLDRHVCVAPPEEAVHLWKVDCLLEVHKQLGHVPVPPLLPLDHAVHQPHEPRRLLALHLLVYRIHLGELARHHLERGLVELEEHAPRGGHGGREALGVVGREHVLSEAHANRRLGDLPAEDAQCHLVLAHPLPHWEVLALPKLVVPLAREGLHGIRHHRVRSDADAVELLLLVRHQQYAELDATRVQEEHALPVVALAVNVLPRSNLQWLQRQRQLREALLVQALEHGHRVQGLFEGVRGDVAQERLGELVAGELWKLG